MKLLLLFLCCLCVFQVKANTQVQTCASINTTNYEWTGGGAYPRLQISNDKIYLISDVSGIWLADLNGSVWSHTITGLDNLSISNIEFSQQDKLRGYVTTRAGISTTDNGGLTWRSIKNLPETVTFDRWSSYRNLAINPVDPQSFIFGDLLGNIYEYANSQIIQVISTSFVDPISSLIIFNNGMNLLVGSSENRALYEKEKDTWHLKKKEKIPAVDFETAQVDGKEIIVSVGGQYVFISDDKAETWFKSDISHIVEIGIKVNRVATAINESGNLSIVISWSKGWKSGILESIDNGRHWKNPIMQLHFAKKNPTRSWKSKSLGKVMSVYIDKKRSNNWYLSTYWGIWHSFDSGRNWYENFKTGASNTVGSSITLAENGDLITASMDVGLLRYKHHAGAISTLIPNTLDYNEHKWVAGHFWNIILSGKRMIATNSPWWSNANQIVISEDRGVNWNVVHNGLPDKYATENTIWEKGYARALIQDPVNKDKFYLGIDGQGLFISGDGGYHWTSSFKQPENLRIYNGLALNSKNNIIYWGTVGGGVYASKDDGKSWNLNGLRGKAVFDLEMAGDGVLYAGIANNSVTGASIAKKESVNSPWKLLQDFSMVGTVDAITIDPKQAKRVVVGVNGWSYNNNGALFISNDGGDSWNEILEYRGAGVADMVISPCSNMLYISGYSSGVRAINLTSYL